MSDLHTTLNPCPRCGGKVYFPQGLERIHAPYCGKCNIFFVPAIPCTTQEGAAQLWNKHTRRKS